MKRGDIINRFIKQDNYYIMIIDSPKYGIKEFLIDVDDYEKVSKYTWALHVNYDKQEQYETIYYATSSKAFGRLLHRFIMNAPKGMVVDHIYGDTFDTRKENLRICTHTENCRNRKKQYNNTSGYQGVTWDKFNNKWMAFICIDTHQKTLGYFDDKEKAHKYRLKIVKESFGEYVRDDEQ